MSDNIFNKQVELDILRLHQQTCRSLLATQCRNCTEVCEVPFVTLDGRYYVLSPQSPDAADVRAGILLIEAEDEQARLSWVATAQTVQCKSSLYCRALEALQRRVQNGKQSLSQAAHACLLELTPQQGRLTLQQRHDFALSPTDLVKALYPALHTIGALPM